MEPEGSLPHSQVLATCPYHEPHRSSPCTSHFLKSILIFSSHLRLGVPSGLFPSGFFTKTHYTRTPLLSPVRAKCPAHILLDFISRTIFGEEYRSSLYSFLNSPVISSLLSPNILLSTLVSNTLSLHSSLNVSYQVSHLSKTTNKIVVLYIIFKYLDSKLEYKRFCTEW